MANSKKSRSSAAQNARIRNVKARMLVSLVIIALVAGIIFTFLNIRPAGAGTQIDSDWKTPSYLKNKTMTVLICGVAFDPDDPEHQNALTDVIMLANLDREKSSATLLQIPRDTYVGENLVYTGKINALYNWGYKDGDGTGGISVLAETINRQLKLPIDNYVLITMDGFRKAVDILGGVEITLEKELDMRDKDGNGTVLSAGVNVLNGETAEQFVRFRGYQMADIERMNAQRYFMAALMKKLLSTSTMDLASLAQQIYPYLETDLSIQEIITLAFDAKKLSMDSISTIRMPGEPIAKYGIYGLDVWSLHKKETADLLNEYMRPYTDDVPETDLEIIEIQKTTTINDESGTTLDNYGG